MKKRYISFIILFIAMIIFCIRQRTWMECEVKGTPIHVESEILDHYILQGICKVDEYTLVSAYSSQNPLEYSIVLIYNEDGSLYNMIQLDNYTHAGAISVYDGMVYISGIGLQKGDPHYQYVGEEYPNEALIQVYYLKDFLDITFYNKVIPRSKTIYFADFDSLLYSSASVRGNSLFSELTVGMIQGQVCILGSNYTNNFQAHLVIIPLTSIGENGVIDNTQITYYDLPINRLQGICMVDENTFLFTQTNGEKLSKLYKCKIKDGKVKVQGKVKIPSHAEQVSMVDENTIVVVFEYMEQSIRYFNYNKFIFW